MQVRRSAVDAVLLLHISNRLVGLVARKDRAVVAGNSRVFKRLERAYAAGVVAGHDHVEVGMLEQQVFRNAEAELGRVRVLPRDDFNVRAALFDCRHNCVPAGDGGLDVVFRQNRNLAFSAEVFIDPVDRVLPDDRAVCGIVQHDPRRRCVCRLGDRYACDSFVRRLVQYRFKRRSVNRVENQRVIAALDYVFHVRDLLVHVAARV
ncbi:MAG: hypothetical protein DELT_03246 [Desulfovibrio sp.]